MAVYCYLSLTPEALILSMLPPLEFGSYLAVGTQKRTRGQAIFFAVDKPDELPFDLGPARARCVPRPNGEPKHSVYVSIYRVLEQVPLGAVSSLYLVTPDGRVLEVPAAREIAHHAAKYHLYQEISPVHPRVVSTLGPEAFNRSITDPRNPIHVPRICFADLRLGDLARDPEKGSVRDLPYHAVEHLRDCLLRLRDDADKQTKMVDRSHPQTFPYRTVESGVYLGDSAGLCFYPFPGEEQLQSEYYEWWRSASIMSDMFEI